MVWPTALTVNADILKYVFEQGLTRTLEGANTFTDLHEGVAIEVRLWLESKGGISDADLIVNTDDFKPAAAHLFTAKWLRSRDLELSEAYSRKFNTLMFRTRAELSTKFEAGGTLAQVVLIKQSSSPFYTTRRSGQVFKFGRHVG